MAKLKRINVRSDFLIAGVRYLDFEQDSPPDISPEDQYWKPPILFFQKRRSHAHEEEVRVAIPNPTDVPYEVHEECLPYSKGFGVPVVLPDLIEGIVVSPEYPDQAILALQEVVNRAGLRVGVERSGLLNPHNKDGEEALCELLKTMGPAI